MTVTKPNISNFLEPILKTWAFDGFAEVDSMIPEMAGIETSTKSEETYADAIGSGLYEEFNASVKQDTIEQGYSKKLVNKTYTSSIPADYDAMADEQYPIIKRKATALGSGAKYTRELFFTSIFEHAFDTTVASGGDGYQLCYASHTSPKSGVSTQSNAGSTALSQTSIISTRTAMRKFTDQKGFRYAGTPDGIVCGVDLESTAIKAMESVYSSATFESNPIQSTYKPKLFILPLLQDATNWFMVDTKMMKKNLIWQNRDPFRVVTFDEPMLRKMTVIGSYRCAVGFPLAWQWIYGHAVAG